MYICVLRWEGMHVRFKRTKVQRTNLNTFWQNFRRFEAFSLYQCMHTHRESISTRWIIKFCDIRNHQNRLREYYNTEATTTMMTKRNRRDIVICLWRCVVYRNIYACCIPHLSSFSSTCICTFYSKIRFVYLWFGFVTLYCIYTNRIYMHACHAVDWILQFLCACINVHMMHAYVQQNNNLDTMFSISFIFIQIIFEFTRPYGSCL